MIARKDMSERECRDLHGDDRTRIPHFHMSEAENDTRDDQALTAGGCTVEEAAIGDAIIPVLAKAVSMPGQRVDRWTFEEGWRCGREYERRRLDADLTAAEKARDEAKQIIANFTACLEEDPRYVAMRDKAERAEAALAAEGDPLCVCQDTGARAIKGACPEHHGDACLINLPGYCIRATEDREARFRAEAALAEALDVIEAVVAGIVTLDGARVVLRKHGRLP